MRKATWRGRGRGPWKQDKTPDSRPHSRLKTRLTRVDRAVNWGWKTQQGSENSAKEPENSPFRHLSGHDLLHTILSLKTSKKPGFSPHEKIYKMFAACICNFDHRFCDCKAARDYPHPAASIFPHEVQQGMNPGHTHAVAPLLPSHKQIREANHLMLKKGYCYLRVNQDPGGRWFPYGL